MTGDSKRKFAPEMHIRIPISERHLKILSFFSDFGIENRGIPEFASDLLAVQLDKLAATKPLDFDKLTLQGGLHTPNRDKYPVTFETKLVKEVEVEMKHRGVLRMGKFR